MPSIQSYLKHYRSRYLSISALRSRYKLLRRSLRFLYQRHTRGWDDSETWSLDHSLAKMIAPRLKQFKRIKAGAPSDITEEQWEAILDEMIEAFEWFGSDDRWNYGPDHNDKLKKAQKGVELFAEWYTGLWW